MIQGQANFLHVAFEVVLIADSSAFLRFVILFKENRLTNETFTLGESFIDVDALLASVPKGPPGDILSDSPSAAPSTIAPPLCEPLHQGPGPGTQWSSRQRRRERMHGLNPFDMPFTLFSECFSKFKIIKGLKTRLSNLISVRQTKLLSFKPLHLASPFHEMIILMPFLKTLFGPSDCSLIRSGWRAQAV